MKLFFTILLLVLASALKAQTLNTLEYYFDTDPGYGNGSHLSLSGTSTDADYSLPMPTLTAGLHSMYMRIKDNAGIWGTTYQKLIFINNGTAGASTITTAEYFFDTDPGFGNGTQLALSGDSINTDVNFNMGSLPAGSHTFYLRLKSNSGAWSTVYQSTVFISAGNAGNTNITTAEYYFDTDPGVGKATTILLNSNSLDSNFKVNTTGLFNGIHTLVIRLKNSNNAWSTSYENDVNISSGIDSVPQITSLEIFNDSDKGINKNTSVALNKKSLIDTTISVFVPDNGKDNSTLGLRLHNQAGQIGNVALQNISLCDLYKPQAGFRSVQYANTVTLIDTSKYNPSNKLRWYADGVLLDSAYTVNYTFPSGYIGTKTIKLIAGTGCRIDSSSHFISIQGVEQFSPTSGSYSSDYELNIYGGGMDSSLIVYLQKGDTIVYPYSKIAIDGKRLIAIFDFHKYPRASQFGGVYEYDNYKLHVIFPNSYHYVSPYASIYMNKLIALGPCDGVGAQYVNCPKREKLSDGEIEPYFQTTLVGNNDIRTGVWSTFSLNVTNTGQITAKSIPVYLLLPAHFKVDTSGFFILTNYPQLRDSLSLGVPIDTVIGGQHLQLKLYALIVPLLGPGETFSIPFRVLTTQGGTSKIMYWADRRMFGSPFKPFWGPCADAIFNLVVGFVPIAGCLNSAYDFASGAQSYISNPNAAHKPSTGSMVISAGGTLLSCATGIPFGSKLATAATTMVKEIAEVAEKGGKVLKIYIADKIAGGIGFSSGGESNPCDSKSQQEWQEQSWYERFGVDPNHMSGNNQYDSAKHWIDNYSSQKYFVSFENKPTATANAQHVYVTDTLNPAKFAFTQFSMNHFMIGDSMYTLPPYRYNVTQDVGIKSSSTMKVRFSASFDTTTGILKTDFFSIDLNGKVLPLDSIAGFLPPNTDGEIGTGSFQFEIPALNMNTNDTFMNKAIIYFDNNDPIATNTWLNTVDTTSPKSKILIVIPVSDTTVKLVIQRSDVGSGVRYTSLFIMAGNDTVFRNAGIGIGDTVLFTGQRNQTYKMFTKATDHVGNVEFKDSVAEVTFVLSNALPLNFLSFTAKIVDKKTQLKWSTTNEVNTDRFDIERSVDGQHFINIGNQVANNHSGTNSYTSFDNNPNAGYNYYRLKQYDRDGHYTYSTTIKLYYGTYNYITITPNPAKDYVDIQTNGKISQVVIFDASGKKVKVFVTTTGNRYPLTGISKGLYFLQVLIDGELHTSKLQVE